MIIKIISATLTWGGGWARGFLSFVSFKGSCLLLSRKRASELGHLPLTESLTLVIIFETSQFGRHLLIVDICLLTEVCSHTLPEEQQQPHHHQAWKEEQLHICTLISSGSITGSWWKASSNDKPWNMRVEDSRGQMVEPFWNQIQRMKSSFDPLFPVYGFLWSGSQPWLETTPDTDPAPVVFGLMIWTPTLQQWWLPHTTGCLWWLFRETGLQTVVHFLPRKLLEDELDFSHIKSNELSTLLESLWKQNLLFIFAMELC